MVVDPSGLGSYHGLSPKYDHKEIHAIVKKDWKETCDHRRMPNVVEDLLPSHEREKRISTRR